MTSVLDKLKDVESFRQNKCLVDKDFQTFGGMLSKALTGVRTDKIRKFMDFEPLSYEEYAENWSDGIMFLENQINVPLRTRFNISYFPELLNEYSDNPLSTYNSFSEEEERINISPSGPLTSLLSVNNYPSLIYAEKTLTKAVKEKLKEAKIFGSYVPYIEVTAIFNVVPRGFTANADIEVDLLISLSDL